MIAMQDSKKGAKHGFNKALFAVRNVDKQLEYPEKGSKTRSHHI